MIYIIIGGVGQGKSLTMVKEVLENSLKGQRAFVNFSTKRIQNVKRLKFQHFIKIDQEVSERGKVTTTKSINYDFWKEQFRKGPFSIYIDELHNIFSSRRAMSKNSVLLMQFFAQIRKILQDREDCHLYCITQKLMRVDPAIREMGN